MPLRGDPRKLYRRELDQIERIVGFVCRRNGLSPEEAEELRSEVHLRLLEDDCRVLLACHDEEELGSYLFVVVQRLLLDFRRSRWGKWRASAAARRAGTTAIRLETLVVRDGRSFEEAFRILRDNEGIDTPRDELYALLATFPQRHGAASRRRATLEDATEAVATPPAGPVEADERAELETTAAAVLRDEVAGLPAEDRLILRMVHRDGHPVSVVARTLGLEQRPLYRRVNRLRRRLRRALEAAGVTRERFRELVEGGRGLELMEIGEILAPRPSDETEGRDEELPRENAR